MKFTWTDREDEELYKNGYGSYNKDAYLRADSANIEVDVSKETNEILNAIANHLIKPSFCSSKDKLERFTKILNGIVEHPSVDILLKLSKPLYMQEDLSDEIISGCHALDDGLSRDGPCGLNDRCLRVRFRRQPGHLQQRERQG